jgi:hypothetical protein
VGTVGVGMGTVGHLAGGSAQPAATSAS